MKNDTQTHAANPADNATDQHTPLPWHIGMRPGPMIYGPKGEQVADMRNETLMPEENPANARRIVESVNSAPRLKSERDEALAMLTRVQEIFECGEDLSNVNFFGTEQNQIRALIARIEKGGAL